MSKLVFIGNCLSDPEYIYKYRYLTFGKVYDEVESHDDGYVCVVNDLGEEELYVYYKFMDLDVWRELRIKEVLGEV